MKKIILALILGTSLFAVDLNTGIIPTKKDCIDYEGQYSRFTAAFNRLVAPVRKKVSIHMIKATQDDLIKYCGKYIDISLYKKQKPLVEQIYYKYWKDTK